MSWCVGSLFKILQVAADQAAVILPAYNETGVPSGGGSARYASISIVKIHHGQSARCLLRIEAAREGMAIGQLLSVIWQHFEVRGRSGHWEDLGYTGKTQPRYSYPLFKVVFEKAYRFCISEEMRSNLEVGGRECRNFSLTARLINNTHTRALDRSQPFFSSTHQIGESKRDQRP